MSVLDTILDSIKTGLEGIRISNDFATDVVAVYPYPEVVGQLSYGKYPCISLVVQGDIIVRVNDEDGRRMEAALLVTGYLETIRPDVQEKITALDADIKNYFDDVVASSLATSCRDVTWIDGTIDMLEERAQCRLDVRITYYCAKGEN